MAAVTPGSYGARASIGATALALTAVAKVITAGVVIKALGSNSGIVYVGNDENVTTATGFPLAAGEQQSFDAKWFTGWSPLAQSSNCDLQTIYVIGSGAGQEVRFWWV
jgi:hypothetical protein